jgi:hypothetical protein
VTEYSWHFNKHQRGYQTRDPIQSEFFTQDSVSEPGAALIREGIQNALDARLTPDSKVVVRVFLSGNQEALTMSELDPFISNLMPHLRCSGNGLDNPPKDIDTCPFLVFEDFETTGLTGDEGEGQFSKAHNNHFFNFFRAEGRSDKGADSIGRWGVGKSVFNLASSASTMICLTVRSDDKAQLLMGRTVLKHHLLDQADYVPDGYLGGKLDESGCFIYPIDDDAYIDQFRKTFQLFRDRNQTGLSIVVPWYNRDDINQVSIVKSTLKDYFWPILQNKLEVWVQLRPAIDLVLSGDSLLSELNKLEPVYKADVQPVVNLAMWALESGSSKRITLEKTSATKAPSWSPELFPGSSLASLKRDLLSETPIALRVPVSVKLFESRAAHPSYFDIYVRRDDANQDGRSIFIREGIVIPEVRSRRVKNYRCLVVIEEKALATMLGDAENPAHTEWRKETRGFKAKYKHAVGTLEFVTNSPSEIIKILVAEDEELDRRILSDLFSTPIAVEEPEVAEEAPEATEEPGKDSPSKQLVAVDDTPEGLRLRRIRGGFSIVCLQGFDWQNNAIILEVAYFTRKGNPFKSYNPADFSLGAGSIDVQIVNGELAFAKLNQIKIRPTESGCKLVATGFDTNRDLKVRASLEKREHASQTFEFHGA